MNTEFIPMTTQKNNIPTVKKTMFNSKMNKNNNSVKTDTPLRNSLINTFYTKLVDNDDLLPN